MKIKTTDIFEKSFKKLLKKDRNLLKEYETLLIDLHNNPHIGKSLGSGKYKIRIKNKSNNKGKSAGYRVITYTQIEETLVLVYIYSKSQTENVISEKIDAVIRDFK